MTVTYKGIKPGSETGDNNGGIRVYSATYMLESDTATDGPYTVGSNVNLPLIGSYHYEDPFATCRSLHVTNPNPYKGWEVDATWSTAIDGGATNEDPTQDTAIISTQGERFAAIVTTDKDGNPATNSAGDFFADPPLEADDSRRLIVIEKNLPAGLPTWFLSYENAVNSASVTIGGLSFDARTLKMDPPEVSTTLTRNDIDYVRVRVVFQAKKDTWDFAPLDAGYNRIGDNGDPVKITLGGDGTLPTEPVKLDGNGQPIPGDHTGQGNFLNIRHYPELDFSAVLTELGL